ncbi:DISARM system helicase DrmA [Nakamurella multipartita]|uniref:Helicase domain protein n=1 Tax=Nakamurella multipartita (strain ATCC 700099 / DSM 44233 / CIP 104796 / JCM 9543 / NBRC 105858 / Y-104) TaxID=479431 RepID=C8X716_NAKMY|nr:DISARM system helicase DrmA [Nakamurella multipartita]ACV76885.1 helicase domain protein [Nakamurella multipartita DSM 44233]
MTSPVGWQLPQEFEAATGSTVRDGMVELVSRDLLGPWGGEVEEFAPRAAGPRDRYLIGMLGPRTIPGRPAEVEPGQADTETGGDTDGEADLPDVLSPQALGRIWASSMGLSFAIDSSVTSVAVEATWGAYEKVEFTQEEGRKVRIWRRQPVRHVRSIATHTVGDDRVWLSDPKSEPFGIWLSVQVRDHDDGSGRPHRIVRVSLVNGQAEDVTPKDLAWLFQAGLVVTAGVGGSSIFEPIGDVEAGAPVSDDPEEQHLALLFRNQLRHASGHNVAVHVDRRPGERTAHRLSTTWLPSHDVPQVSATADPERLRGLELSMDALAELSDGPSADLVLALQPLVTGYSTWLDEQSDVDIPDRVVKAGADALGRADVALNRLRAGIDHLRDNSQARAAFGFANRAMALQRRNTQASQLRERDPDLSHRQALADRRIARPEAASWRPFQLAFVLLNLPGLTQPGHPDRSDLVDLLFFPTGGGKTEAYLGLTAYTFALRRLQGSFGAGVAARDGRDGVAVLMRYMLRLLTAQQFQRAAALVCAAEVLRRDDPDTWGTRRFGIGLWVGGSVTPNWYPEAAEAIAEARETGRGSRTSVLQTLRCPWCGAQLAAHRDLHTEDFTREVILYCAEGEGRDACPFSRTGAPGSGLPILTVDEQIYRHPPSLLIATVDKLAQLPWYGFAGMLFGRVTRECPRHGYRHPDLDERIGCTDRHNASGGHPAVKSVPVVPLRPPDLIIQDELHLISGALGTTVGLFESAVDELTSWALPGGDRTGPKIIASTATTKRAAEQVRRLYARDLAVFPPQVLDAADTFFSVEVPVDAANPGRRYLGICAHGVRLKSAEIRIAEILLLAGQTLFDIHGEAADAYATLVGYFNATRELAGMRRYLEDDVAVRLQRNGRRRGISDRLTRLNPALSLTELTSRVNSGDIADVLEQLEKPFLIEQDTSARRRALFDAVMQARKAKDETFSMPRPSGAVDVVLATSMLQVGVDVQRLGLMLVVGQPKNTAEYIQASSRVGRDAARPGLVVTLYNWTRPRDLAHFEDFEPYHASFYRRVEALSVTPFSRRSLDRTTAATYIAAVRHAAPSYSANPDAFDVTFGDDPAVSVTRRMLNRAERAGDPHARDYLQDRIDTLQDRWNQEKGGSSRLGYQTRKVKGQQLVGLIRPAGQGPWDDLTVGRSMRETENEINLLVPASGMFTTSFAPAWTYATTPDGTGDDDDPGAGDELGEAGP